MPEVKFEVIVETGYHLGDADTLALNFLSDALHKALKGKTPVHSFSARLISPGEAKRLEEWKVLMEVPWNQRTPEQQAKIDELSQWFASDEIRRYQ